jgi:hypothetical protein
MSTNRLQKKGFSMTTQSQDWIVNIHREAAFLLRPELTEKGRSRLVQVGVLTNKWQEPAAGKPSMLTAAKTDHAYASEGHGREEYRRRYAIELAAWVERIIRENQLRSIKICAPVRLHGELRPLYSPFCQGKIIESRRRPTTDGVARTNLAKASHAG